MVSFTNRLNRRTFGALSIGAAAAATSFRAVAAQDASPEASPATGDEHILEGLGLTALTITATEFTFNMSNPGSLAEGWYVISLINDSGTDASANLALLPEGANAGDLSALKPQAFAGEGGELPEWWSQATFAGGTFAAPGESASVVVYLTPGQWSIFSTNPASIQTPANFRILTPEDLEANYGIVPEATPMASPAAIAAPEGLTPSLTLTVSDTGMTPSDQPGEGHIVVEVVNEGEQVHDVVVLHTDETLDEASAGSMALSWIRGEEVNARPEGGVGTLSPGGTAYAELHGHEGSHLVFSSLPDANGGVQLETVGVIVY